MLIDILFALWFFLPAGAANMMPVFAASVPGLAGLNAPLDFGKTFRGKRIFGAHKTWRGLIVGMIAATLVLWLQQQMITEWGWFAGFADRVDYADLPLMIVGPLFAIGALGGDAAKSFFKRQFNKAPGQVWFPYDLIDHIIGAALVVAPFVYFSWWVYPAVVAIWLVVNLAVSYGGYLLHLKERPL